MAVSARKVLNSSIFMETLKCNLRRSGPENFRRTG
jgi:hypothetical protein